MVTKIEDSEEYFTQLRAKYETQRKEALASLQEAEGWLRGLDALERERRSKQPSPSLGESKTTASKQPRGKWREVLELVRAHPNGLFAREVAQELGVSDDKQQAAVNAALFNLKKQGFLSQEGRGGRYVAVAKRSGEESELTGSDEEA